jgi:hypothetical protein
VARETFLRKDLLPLCMIRLMSALEVLHSQPGDIGIYGQSF